MTSYPTWLGPPSGTRGETIGEPDNPYLYRWYLIPRNRWFNIYLHKFMRSDDERALHDHPWPNVSILLKGNYIEHVPGGERFRKRFRPVFRRATSPHRVALIGDRPVWSLFLTGRKWREWGFLCPQGWRHHAEFIAATPEGNIMGKGCD